MNILDGVRMLNLCGSNAEKISGIIQNMDLPFIALKAISLFNLMFYVLRRLSHDMERIGFIM